MSICLRELIKIKKKKRSGHERAGRRDRKLGFYDFPLKKKKCRKGKLSVPLHTDPSDSSPTLSSASFFSTPDPNVLLAQAKLLCSNNIK